MTAIITIQESDRVHIVVDGSEFDVLGRMTMLGVKVIPVPHLDCAIALRGPKLLLTMLAGFVGSGSETFDDLRENAVFLLREAALMFETRFPDAGRGHHFDCVVAGIDGSGTPQAFVVCNHNFTGPQPWVRTDLPDLAVLGSNQETLNDLLGKGVERSADGFIDIDRFGLRIIERMRREPMPAFPHGRFEYLVGGFAALTTVSAGGSSTRILHRWPDTIGERIAPVGDAA